MKSTLIILIISGLMVSTSGKVCALPEVSRFWEVKEISDDDFQPVAFHPISDDNVWVAGYDDTISGYASVIFHYHNGEWIKEGAVPNIGVLGDIVVVGPSKGWVIGARGLLEYDGVFWSRVPDVPGVDGAGRSQAFRGIITDGFQLISAINENEVWFANGYIYTNGQYSQFTLPSNSPNHFLNIAMVDDQTGIATDLNEKIYFYSDSTWTEVGSAGSLSHFLDSLSVWKPISRSLAQISIVDGSLNEERFALQVKNNDGNLSSPNYSQKSSCTKIRN
jgi:hypothetical protein